MVHFDSSNGGVGDIGGNGDGGDGGGCSLSVDHKLGGPSNCWQDGQPYLINHASAPVNMSQVAWLVWFSLTVEDEELVVIDGNGKRIINHPRMSLSNAFAFLNIRYVDCTFSTFHLLMSPLKLAAFRNMLSIRVTELTSQLLIPTSLKDSLFSNADDISVTLETSHKWIAPCEPLSQFPPGAKLKHSSMPVSYTHLTLPTILLV